MIFDVLILMAAGLLASLGQALNIIPYVLPNNIENAIIYFIGYLNYLRPILDIDTLMSAMGVLFTIIIYLYSVKLVLWIWAMTPWFGRSVPLPTVSNKNIVDLSNKKNTLNLRQLSQKQNFTKTTKDIK